MSKVSIIVFSLILLAGCNGQPGTTKNLTKAQQQVKLLLITVLSSDSNLALINGQWFYRRTLFNGIIEKKDSAGRLITKQSIANGVEEGWQFAYYPGGRMESKRFYHLGEKDSLNMGWWPNGKPRYAYHFRNGVYEGDFDEWYQSGNPLKHIVYHNGKEQSGKGWRDNGKLYMSFVRRNGRLYGLINANLCYSLKNEQGEFIPSATEKKSPL